VIPTDSTQATCRGQIFLHHHCKQDHAITWPIVNNSGYVDTQIANSMYDVFRIKCYPVVLGHSSCLWHVFGTEGLKSLVRRTLHNYKGCASVDTIPGQKGMRIL